MLSYCLKCNKNTENINPKFEEPVMVKQCYYQNVLYVVLKNQDLIKEQKARKY